MDSLLDRIQSPKDLKELDIKELTLLADEIRKFMISVVCQTGGHLAPNLGAVELTIALHKILDAPKDKIVWDVGHQAYVHKILTDRKERFHTLRQYGGISGFPRIDESEYDTFGVGHASTAISAALGMATARDMKGEDYKVVAVVGDGALTGGVAFEGLNNAGGAKRDLVVILNDNRMSISPNVGALSKTLTQVITTSLYNKIKADVWELTGKLPRGSAMLREIAHRIEEGLKAMLVPGSIFESMGFRYFGPIDGHHIGKLIRVFGEVFKLHGPVLVHLITKKGKGYKFAEENATKFHGLGSFCPETGNSVSRKAPTYTEIFGKTVVELAEKDEKIVGITAAMADGTGLIHLAKKIPERFFDVGIAEQHAVTFASALALQGFKPVVAIYSTFLQRAFDQLIHDVALQKIPMVFALDRGGLVGEDGPTHHGSFDLSYLRLIPNFILMTPKDENELRDMLYTAFQYREGPIAIRYPRGESLGLVLKPDYHQLELGKAEILKKGHDVAILAVGDRVMAAMRVAEKLEKEHISVSVVNGRFIKPLDEEMIRHMARHHSLVVTLENNAVLGGFGGGVAEVLMDCSIKGFRFRRFGIPDRFITYGKRPELLREIGLDDDTLAGEIKKILKSKFKSKNFTLKRLTKNFK